MLSKRTFMHILKKKGLPFFTLILLCATLLLFSPLLVRRFTMQQIAPKGVAHSIGGGIEHNIQPDNNHAIDITVDLTAPIGTSQFAPGITHVDPSLDPGGSGDPVAVNHIKGLIRQGVPYEATPIMAWGVDDPWPDPRQQEPSNWTSLDNRLRLITETGGIPVLTLNEAPWWMKGQLQPDGTTRQLTWNDEWADIAYSSRILDNKMNAWLHLVQRVAERYMAPPYNVRYFQVWNELKGYYNPITNSYDYTTSPGDPSQAGARHGYTYMYNQVYRRLMQVATSLGMARDSVKVGGPYVVIDTWSSPNQSNPSQITRTYGTFDQRPLSVVQYWLQHKVGAGFITLDSANDNKDNVNTTDPFTASEKFADVTRWVRSLNNDLYPGATTLPIWWAEWYATALNAPTNPDYNNAIKTYAVAQLIEAGGGAAFEWGGLGDGPANTGLWTQPAAGGGQPLPWYYSYKALKDNFGPGTHLYKADSSAPGSVAALASAKALLLINKSSHRLDIAARGHPITLAPYQVRVIGI